MWLYGYWLFGYRKSNLRQTVKPYITVKPPRHQPSFLLFFQREQAIEETVYLVCYESEVLRIVFVIHVVDINREDLSGIILIYEMLITLVEPFQIVQLYALFVVPSAFLYVCYKMVDVSPEVNHQVRCLGNGHHLLEEFHVCPEVTVGYGALVVVVLGEYIYALEYGTVLDDSFLAVRNVLVVLNRKMKGRSI